MGKATGKTSRGTQTKTASVALDEMEVPFDLSQKKRAPMCIEWLHPSQLFIDREVLVNPRMPEDRLSALTKIANVFDWNNVNVWKVAQRSGGRYAVLNGGGTLHIIQNLLPDHPDYADYLLPCHVVDSSVRTRAHEAGVFGSQRFTKKLTGTDFFIGELISKSPEATAIQKIFHDIGMTIPGNPKKPVQPWPFGFNRIAVARALFREGDLSRTVLLARAAWRGCTPAPDGIAITAVGILLKAYPRLDEGRMREVLSQNNPHTLQNDLRLERGKMHIYQKAVALASKYVDLYDHDYRGDLIGGTRSKQGTRTAYTKSLRTELSDAGDKLISIWKLAGKAKPSEG